MSTSGSMAGPTSKRLFGADLSAVSEESPQVIVETCARNDRVAAAGRALPRGRAARGAA